ncbi:hypothetical protein OHS81_00180 [Streptomyces sp. NBC_00400]
MVPRRERALDYLDGLVAPLENKNGWIFSEQVGQLRPDGVQRLLNLSDWDEEGSRPGGARDNVALVVVRL